MQDKKRIELPYHSERENYIPHDANQANNVYKRIRKARFLLFFSPIIHIGASGVLLILLLLDLLIDKKLGLNLTGAQKPLAFSYVGATILFDFLFFVLPAKKFKKKSHFRILAISTLIISTLIFSGSLFFWSRIPLLFYSLVTLVVWIIEIYVSVLLISIVEELPN